jgi:hypothetical protein
VTLPAASYRAAILQEAPRVLGLLDREPFSPTRGCSDRTWWAWKFTDFPGPRFQESVCVLSFLFATPFDGNPYHGNANVLEWIGAALGFWVSRQHADGSFDEAYPFERSLAATAFTSFYVGEAVAFLGGALSKADRDRTVAALARAGAWLERNDEHHGFLSNHRAAAAAALLHVARLTGEQRLRRRARWFVDGILARQSDEGWYEEYGGADPGYQTHGSFYLARYWQLTGEDDVLASLARANRFLAHFVHPDGSIGGEYASRGTQTYYPAAFEMLGDADPAAAWIAETLRPSVGSASAVGLSGVDAYNYFPCLNNLVFASLSAKTRTAPDPTEGKGLSWFPRAGMARLRRDAYEAFVGVSKGGAVKVFERGTRRLLASDCGWVGELAGGATVSSHYLDAARPATVSADRIEVGGTFRSVRRPVFTPWRFAAFRVFNLTVGRLPAVARWLKRLLVRTLITRHEAIDIGCRRVLTFGEDGVRVSDELQGSDAVRLVRIARASAFTSIHMGSARYFVPHELESPPAAASTPVDPSQVVRGVRLEYEVRARSA